MVNPQDVGTYALGGTGVLAAVVFLGRKIWQNFTGAQADTQKAQADAAIFSQMRQQLTDLATEIKELKAEHKKEKAELEARITNLEAKVYQLVLKVDKSRKHALDAYAALTSVRECGKACKNIEDAIVHIKKILEDE
jgi:hypothetical protein